ncbi:hypothetical protein AA313_de0207197 [Arthrobotrys entomopaga]|nr:hypothetical protein AA313_de0207197 [Arthrobotrys entomopaga]
MFLGKNRPPRYELEGHQRHSRYQNLVSGPRQSKSRGHNYQDLNLRKGGRRSKKKNGEPYLPAFDKVSTLACFIAIDAVYRPGLFGVSFRVDPTQIFLKAACFQFVLMWPSLQRSEDERLAGLEMRVSISSRTQTNGTLKMQSNNHYVEALIEHSPLEIS